VPYICMKKKQKESNLKITFLYKKDL
jgi:hypothetical protein